MVAGPGDRVIDRAHARRGESDPVTHVHLARRRSSVSRTAWVTSPATTLQADAFIEAAFSSAEASGSYSSNAAKPSTIESVGTTVTVCSTRSFTCSATGRMFLLFGKSTTCCGTGRLDRRDEVGGRRVHRLTAGDEDAHAERAKDATDAVAHDDRDDRRRRGRVQLARRAGRHFLRGPSALRSPVR